MFGCCLQGCTFSPCVTLSTLTKSKSNLTNTGSKAKRLYLQGSFWTSAKSWMRTYLAINSWKWLAWFCLSSSKRFGELQTIRLWQSEFLCNSHHKIFLLPVDRLAYRCTNHTTDLKPGVLITRLFRLDEPKSALDYYNITIKASRKSLWGRLWEIFMCRCEKLSRQDSHMWVMKVNVRWTVNIIHAPVFPPKCIWQNHLLVYEHHF